MPNFVTLLFVSLLSIITPTNTKAQYKDFVLANSSIWGLTADGKINVIDRKSKTSTKILTNGIEITNLAKDRTGAIVIVDKNNELKKYSEVDNSWQPVKTLKNKLFGLVFDSHNRGYAITVNGIQDVATGKIYFADSSLNHQVNYRDGWRNIKAFHIDKANNIWVGFGFGEWGGDIFIFNTDQKKFVTLSLDEFKIMLHPIQSFFEDSTSIYASTGLQHMMTSGEITQFKDFRATVLFESDSHWSKPFKVGKETLQELVGGEYIGPAAFSPYDNAIYFYSQNGLFRGDRSKNLAYSQNWKKIATPRLKWSSGQPDAVGSPMNVIKLVATGKSSLVFLSQHDGIGFFDNGRVIMVK